MLNIVKLIVKDDQITSVNQIRWQAIDWDAIISPLKILRIQTCIVSPEDKEKTHALEHKMNIPNSMLEKLNHTTDKTEFYKKLESEEYVNRVKR